LRRIDKPTIATNATICFPGVSAILREVVLVVEGTLELVAEDTPDEIVEDEDVKF
jgi:hypothetical protein